MYDDILKNFSDNIKEKLYKEIQKENQFLEEIRIRNNNPIILKFSNAEKILKEKISSNDILEILQHICDNSIYSYQSQICEGFITIKGGHRVGITGNAVIEKDKVINIKNISGLNIRIARQIIGASKNIIGDILDINNNTIYNTLIISPPRFRQNYYFKRFSKRN